MAGHASEKFDYHEPGLQHQFEDMKQQEESVSIGMWMFLVQEIMFFGGLVHGLSGLSFEVSDGVCRRQ